MSDFVKSSPAANSQCAIMSTAESEAYTRAERHAAVSEHFKAFHSIGGLLGPIIRCLTL